MIQNSGSGYKGKIYEWGSNSGSYEPIKEIKEPGKESSLEKACLGRNLKIIHNSGSTGKGKPLPGK